jgi:hypothetical protein
MSSEEAVFRAEEMIKQNREFVSKRIIEQYQEPSKKEKISFITKF